MSAPGPGAERGQVLLMTATIAPNVAPGQVARADPELRRRDYEATLAAYLALPLPWPERILFCENSGADLGSLRRLAAEENPHRRPVDFLPCDTAGFTHRSKGIAELALLDAAMDAAFARDAPGPLVWKVTGRLFVRNFARMAASAPPDAALYADFRAVPWIGERFGGNRWMDTRLFAVTPEGYFRLIWGVKGRSSTTIEKFLFAELTRGDPRARGIHPRFRVQPVFSGYGAGANRNYSGPAYALKTGVRRLLRRAWPALWI